MASAQQQLAEFVALFPSKLIAEDARNVARQSLIDTLGVALGGRLEPAVVLASTYVGSKRVTGGATSWFDGAGYAPEEAALLNAVAAHALDYDDVTPAWRGHPGTVIWPALLAMSCGRPTTLDQLLDAYVVGFEVGAQIASGIVSSHYSAGWHATCTIGVIAAASACARLQQFSAKQCTFAIGLAAAQAAGLQKNFGSLAKPFQAGFAASSAARTARLVAVGVEASENVLEGRGGFFDLYGQEPSISISTPTVSTPNMAIAHHGIEVKQFPNCYATHRAIEAALQLAAQAEVELENIERIIIEGSPGSHKPLILGVPKSVDAARFSVEFGVACALTSGVPRLTTFNEEQLSRPDIQRLVSLSSVHEASDLGPLRTARVSVHASGDRVVNALITDLPGKFGEPAFMRRFKAKFEDCLEFSGLGSCASEVWAALLDSPKDQAFSLSDSSAFRRVFDAAKH